MVGEKNRKTHSWKQSGVTPGGRGLLRYPAAADYIGLAEGTLRNQVDTLGIRSIKIGRRRCFRIEDLDDFIERKLYETELMGRRKRRRNSGESYLPETKTEVWLLITVLITLTLASLYWNAF
nr:helix-turn-helix domain-containing protein [Gluconobacter sp. GP1]